MKHFIRENIRKDKMYIFLLVLTVASGVALQSWRTLFNNFAVEIAHLEGFHVGIIQAARELPGFLTFLAIYLLLILKEHRLSAFSVLICGIGVTLTGFFPSYYGLLFTTLIMSFGFHYYETTNQSLTLQYFDKIDAPYVFGKLKSFTALTNVVVGLSILLLIKFFEYKTIYLIIGLIVIVASIWAFFQNPTRNDIIPQHKKMIFRKKYWLFYVLRFMAGARRQIFVAFAVFLLVQKFEFTVAQISGLFIFNNIVNFFLAPFIARLIVRFGERKILSTEYISMIIVFVGYAFCESKILVAALYIFDHIFFNFSIAINTYFQKVSDPKDIAPSMSVSFTINHIAAVIIPAIGGKLWMLDYKIPFISAAAFSIVSLFFVQKIRIPEHDKQLHA